MSNLIASLLQHDETELKRAAQRLQVDVPDMRWRAGLICAVAQEESDPDTHYGCGVLEVHGEGFGFLRSMYDNLLPGSHDIYVSQSQIRRFNLRTGDTIIGRIRPPKEQERYPALLRVESVNGDAPDADVTPFHEHVAVHPSTRLPLARDPWLQVIDWVAPLGLGHRGLLIGPARQRRTEVLQRLARTFSTDSALEVTVLLSGDRPEEVTSWRETVDAEIIASPFDESPTRQLHVAELAFERARRMAERGAEVLMIVDSWTRLCQASSAESAGRAQELDYNALHRVRRWLATGRDLRDAGSVTLVGTLNSPARSPRDLAIHDQLEELVNWQVSLRDDNLDPSTKGPALQVDASWSRHESHLVAEDELIRRRRWRRDLPGDAASVDAALSSMFRPRALDSGS